jgi:hypothetical protein
MTWLDARHRPAARWQSSAGYGPASARAGDWTLFHERHLFAAGAERARLALDALAPSLLAQAYRCLTVLRSLLSPPFSALGNIKHRPHCVFCHFALRFLPQTGYACGSQREPHVAGAIMPDGIGGFVPGQMRHCHLYGLIRRFHQRMSFLTEPGRQRDGATYGSALLRFRNLRWTKCKACCSPPQPSSQYSHFGSPIGLGFTGIWMASRKTAFRLGRDQNAHSVSADASQQPMFSRVGRGTQASITGRIGGSLPTPGAVRSKIVDVARRATIH